MSVNLILFFLFVHISLLIPGYVVAVNIKIFKKHPGIELGFGYLTSIAFFALLATVTYILKLNWFIPQSIFWLLILSSVAVFIYQKLYKTLIKEWFILCALFLMTVFSLAFIGLSLHNNNSIIPDPEIRSDRNYDTLNVKILNVAQTNANDNYIPYRQAQFFTNKSDPAKDSFIDEWGVHFFQRTPLMGAVSANYFIALDDSLPINYLWDKSSADPNKTYMKFQIIAQILNSLFIIPAFYLIKYFFNRRTALMAALFIITSQFFLYNSFFSWPKSLVAFFILFSWLLIIQKRLSYVVLAGVASGMAYLSHDLAILYIGASVLLLLYQKRFRDSLVLSIVSVLFAIPWLIVSAFLYKKPSSFMLYPISIYGIPQPSQRHEIIRDFLNTSPIRLISIRIESLYYLLSPYQLIYLENGQEAGRRLWALGLFSVPGSLGLGLIIPTIIGAIKKIRDIPFWILAIVPIVLSTVVIGWPKGLGASHFAEASVALLVGLGCFWLVQTKRIIWAVLAYIISTLQLLFFISYSYYHDTDEWLRSGEDILRLTIMALVIIACGIGVYFVKSGRYFKH